MAEKTKPTKEKPAESKVRVIDITYSLKNSIAKKLEMLPQNYSVLVLVAGEEYNDIVSLFCEIFLKDEKLSGVFVTTNKHPSFLEQTILQKIQGINLDNLYFIDCVSQILLESPRITLCSSHSLVELNIAIKQLLSQKPELKFLIFDSASSLTVYNDPRVIKKFVKTVLEFCFQQKTKTVFFATKTASTKELIEEIAVFFDSTIDAKKL